MRRVAARASRALVMGSALLGTACGAAPVGPVAARPAGFDLHRDTLAFANLVRAERPTEAVEFANYCLVMVRAVVQFHRFARFDPGAPRLDDAGYARRVADVLGRDPWSPPLAPGERVAVPGYPGLRAFSAERERLLKTAFGSQVPSMLHWRTWRVGVAFSPGHQAGMAEQLRAEVAAGRPAPVMLTNFPRPDLLNHGVLVYAHRPGPPATFLAYDPNDPGFPMELYFDAASSAFYVPPLPYSPPGQIRVFRLYTSAWF